MKNYYLFLIILSFLCLTGFSETKAQGVEITPFVGYTFPDKFNISDGSAEVGDGINYGIILGKRFNPHYSLELFYLRQEATGEYAFYDYYGGASNYDTDISLSVNYFQIGGCRHLALGEAGKVEAIGGFSLGAVLLSPKSTNNRDYNDAWRFAFGLNLGTKFWFSEKIGLRVQANLLVPVQGAGVGVYAGSGGAGTEVGGFSTITQLGFNAGLIIRLRKSGS